MKWSVHVALMGEARNTYQILYRKTSKEEPTWEI
jgi:hypothetical protein